MNVVQIEHGLSSEKNGILRSDLQAKHKILNL